MNSRIQIRSAVAIGSLVVGMSSAVAQTPSPAAPGTPSKETREKMAAVHERMAACLRSDKPIDECRGQMMKSVAHMPGETGCPMMGAGMHGQMMQDHSAPARTVPPPGTQK